MINTTAKTGTMKGYAIVRDKDGRPKFDNPHNIPKQILDVLTDDDKAYIEELKK